MTIGQTSISIAKIIDHAVRRTGLPVESQTPETVEIAKNNLHFILMNLANRGINFWALDEKFIVLEEGKAKYEMPSGTVDVHNANYRTVTELTGNVTTGATSHNTALSSPSDVVMVYIDSPTTSITVSVSDDDTTYTDVITLDHTVNPSWYSLDGISGVSYVKLFNSNALTINEVRWVSSVRDIPIYRLNRDDYLNLPNKHLPGVPLQYWFDRQLSPIMVTWPVADSNAINNCIQIYRQRQVSDVGLLSQTLEIPPRWLEAIIWQLAVNLAFELPQVAPERISLCSSKAQSALVEAEMEERDNSPVNFAPDIGVYTS